MNGLYFTFLYFMLYFCTNNVSSHLHNSTALNPVHNNSVIHPCPKLTMDCIRQFLSDHSCCSEVYGSVSEPLHFPLSTVELTIADVTNIRRGVIATGLNGVVTVFDVNPSKNHVVMNIHFKNYTAFTEAGTLVFHRKGMEPVTLTDFQIIHLNEMDATIVIPYINKLKLSDAYIYGYSYDPKPKITMGPAVTSSLDPTVQKALGVMAKNSHVIVKEYLSVVAPVMARTFIQQTLCSFNV